jgi:DNA-binding transcriptional LysR family regulator
MNLDLELVRTFLAVIEQGGFTRAAGRLHKTQSTISLHIRRLEEIVGRPLFDRQGRGVALTEQGEVLREPLVWVGARGRAFAADPLPLVMFPHGCVYRPEVLRRMRACARPWEIVYTSTSLAGVQAAVSAGIGITALAESTVLPEFEILGAADGLPALPDTEIALYAGATRSEAARYLGTYLSDSVQNLAPPARGDSLRDAPVRIAH